ncbi:AAC(3) family N-acetyltransferase [Micromonospora zhanjiangensis]|uniref:Aminoglycoside N(3)-acetyltransferase n=1 Tax=Micromonospora zhanjiangensis TaxID=1522057 RepID=A0ABV8KJG6_9ACTN
MPELPPRTGTSLAADLRELGVRPGATILLHASLRSLGWVCGGAPTVVRALLAVLGPAGTLVVPAFTPENRDPSRWSHAPVPERWWPAIRAELPAFDPAVTPCREMGLIAETVRTWPGAVRSPHPQTSFVAVGARARALTARHPITCELGEDSPLAAVEAVGGQALLLGVGFDRCTAFHLAEYRQPGLRHRANRCVVMTTAGRRWISYRAAVLDDSDFAALGADYREAAPNGVAAGPVGGAAALLVDIRDAVAFATGWLVGRGVPTGSLAPRSGRRAAALRPVR